MELSDKAREAQRAYKKAWRDNNRDKLKGYQKTFWEKQARIMEQVTDQAPDQQPEKRNEPLTPGEQAKRLKQAGKTQREIAKEMNISLGTVNKLLKTD